MQADLLANGELARSSAARLWAGAVAQAVNLHGRADGALLDVGVAGENSGLLGRDGEGSENSDEDGGSGELHDECSELSCCNEAGGIVLFVGNDIETAFDPAFISGKLGSRIARIEASLL